MPENDTVRQPGGERLDNQPADFDPVADARGLLRTIRSGALATLDAGSGYPFATLVSVATDLDGSPVMLLSGLSAHRRNIEADPRVSLLLSQGGKGDPLAHPRLTLVGRAAVSAEGRLRQRFLARHPKSALYADFGDFNFFQMTIEGGHLNGGFARAAKLSPAELCTDLSDAQPLVAAEEGALALMNEDHADAIRLYATRLLGQRDGPWRITGLDPDGADLALGDDTARLVFPARVRSSAELRQMLVRLAGEARALPG
jgi:putative heme iron utilization protein